MLERWLGILALAILGCGGDGGSESGDDTTSGTTTPTSTSTDPSTTTNPTSTTSTDPSDTSGMVDTTITSSSVSDDSSDSGTSAAETNDASSETGGGNAFGTISWVADGTPVTEATFNNPAYDPVTTPAPGRTGFTLLAATDDFQEQLTYVLFYAAGETIPAGTYSCGALPNPSDTVNATVAHLGVVAQATDDVVGQNGACSITFDNEVMPGGQVTGTFTVTGLQPNDLGPDIVITDGEFVVTDP